MNQKILKIILLSIFSLAFFSFDFKKISVGSSLKEYASKISPFASQVQAKKKKMKRKKEKAKKISKKETSENNIEMPIAILGDDICQNNTRQALKELFKKDKNNFQLVISSLGKIECAVFGSGVYFWEEPPRFKVGVATSNADSVWFAGALVHESCHVGQFRRNGG